MHDAEPEVLSSTPPAPHAMLDTYREVITPEGVALRLPAAGPVPRALAWTIDFALRSAVVGVCGFVLGMAGQVGMGVMSVLLFVVFWFYPIVFEALWDGQTPGKRALGLRVIAGNGAPIGWLASFARNLLRTVDMLPFGYATGLVACLSDPYSRRLGDMVADTVVVHVPRESGDSAAVASPMPPPVPLLASEQAAVIAFAERAPRLTPARQVELAELAEPLLDVSGPLAVTRMYAIAAWLLGRR